MFPMFGRNGVGRMNDKNRGDGKTIDSEVSEVDVKRARHEAAILAFARAAGRVRELATEQANARRIMELADREMRDSHAAFVKALCDSEREMHAAAAAAAERSQLVAGLSTLLVEWSSSEVQEEHRSGLRIAAAQLADTMRRLV